MKKRFGYAALHVAMLLAAGWLFSAAWGWVEAAERSSRWPAVRAAHLATEPYCALCGMTNTLEVHHLRPFHLAPELELAATNLITLCRHCHLEAGHLGNWTNEVPDLRGIIGDVGRKLNGMRKAKETRK